MKNFFLLALLAGLFAGCATTSTTGMNAEERSDRAQAVVPHWHAYSQVAAMKILEEYGPPDQIRSDRLVWYNKGPWNRIAVWNAANSNYSGTVGPDNLEQTVAYEVPRGKRKALAAFSDKLAVSKDGKELSVRGNSEALNILTLNLADEIVWGHRRPDDARSFYGRIYQLSHAGKSSPYTEGLLFSTNRVVPPRVSEERGDFLTKPLNIWVY
jgi:hypothetical protein